MMFRSSTSAIAIAVITAGVMVSAVRAANPAAASATSTAHDPASTEATFTTEAAP